PTAAHRTGLVPRAGRSRLYLGSSFPGKVRILADLHARGEDRPGSVAGRQLPHSPCPNDSTARETSDTGGAPPHGFAARASDRESSMTDEAVSDEALMLRYQ